MSDFYTIYDSLASGLVSGLLQVGFSSLLSVAAYVLTAISLYTVAKRRGLHNPWLAWIPVANVWLLGSLSDQYRYVTQGQVKSKRKWLLGLKIATSALATVVLVLAISVIVQAVMGVADLAYTYDYDAFLSGLLGPAIRMLVLLVPTLAVKIAFAVVRYMALFDLYKSLDPANATLYLVLSILFSVTEPFFLIFNRNKDLGMPPRRPAPDPAPWQPEDSGL